MLRSESAAYAGIQPKVLALGIFALVMTFTPAMAQSTGGDPTAAFTAKVTQIETISSVLIAGILGVVDMWVFGHGALKGAINWPWVILITIVCIIVGTYSIWKPLLIGV